jgi:predicted Zn-dependent peptidase
VDKEEAEQEAKRRLASLEGRTPVVVEEEPVETPPRTLEVLEDRV